MEHLHHLGPEFEAAYGDGFWTLFVQEAEQRLQAAGLRPAGVADGDLALPGCQFASIGSAQGYGSLKVGSIRSM